MLSIIIPSYNEEGNVAKCASVVSKLLSENGIDYELVFVNDGISLNHFYFVNTILT